MARLEIRLFGEMEVFLDGQFIKFPTQKTKELFAYLVVHHRHAHPRAQLAGLLWPDSDEERAKANLRQTLARLRKALGEAEFLKFSSGAVQFQSRDCWCDVLEFEQALSDLSPSPSPKERGGLPLPFREGDQGVRSPESTLALYRGPFLAGVYEDWVLIEQERLQTLYLEALEKLAQMYAERRDYQRAITTWQRVLRELPWHEQAHRQLIELYALVGDRAAALHQYQEYAEIVQRELNAAPLPEIRTLSERLAQGISLNLMPEQSLVHEMPFAGRERELAQLRALCEKVVRGSSQAVLIGGEIGVGKTTLVQRFLEQILNTPPLGEERFFILHGAGYAQESAIPYMPYQMLLHAVRPTIERIPTETLAQLPAISRRELAHFIPEIQERFPDLEPNPQLSLRQGKARWFAALTELFELLSRERPVILFLDDLQWADDATLEYLSHLVARAKHAPPLRILFIGTYRTEEAWEGSRVRAWLDALEPGRSYHPITLSRLSRAETESCVAQWLGARADDAAALLYAETEGNPLFLRELTRSLVQSSVLSQDPQGEWRLTVTELSAAHIPENVHELIVAALRRAPQRARSLLGLASVIGRDFALAVMQEILYKPEEKILDDLDSLRRAGLIVECQGRYQFAHELMRQVVYEELGADRRRLWHRRVGEVLEKLYPEELDALAGELTGHFECARLWESAITYAMRAGTRAQEIYAYGEAKNFFKKALGLFTHVEARSFFGDRLKHLKLELLQRYTSRGVFPTVADVKPAIADLETAVTEMMDLASELKDETQLCEAYQRLARIRIAQNRWEAVREAQQKALELGYQWVQKQPPGEGVATMLETTAALNKQLYRYGAALNDYQRAAEIWAALGRAHQQGLVLGFIATIQLSVGRLAEARRSAERALECLHGGDPHRQAGVLNNLGLILRELGESQDVRACYERALALMQESKDPRGIGIVLINLGALHSDQGDYAEALRYLEQALELLKQEGTRGLEVELFSEMGRAHAGLGHAALALEHSTRAVRILEEGQGFVTDEYSFYFRHFQILQAQGQLEQARIYLEKAHEELHSAAAKIYEEYFRQSFLENIRLHREIIRAWEAAQHTH